MNRKRLFFVIVMTVFVCFNPVPALAQWWDGWWDGYYYDEYYYDYGEYYEEYYSPPVYYYQPAPLVIGIGGCRSDYDD